MSVKEVKIAGKKVAINTSAAPNSLHPLSGEVKVGKAPKNTKPKGYVRGIPYLSQGTFNSKLYKRVGVIEDGQGAYIAVMRHRILPILGMILLILAALELIIWLVAGQNAIQNTIDYIGSNTGITQPNKDVHAQESGYTSFESLPENISWQAGTTTQSITLSNLDGNGVDVAPEIYVDLNGDGTFSSDECVYNADDTKRLSPGTNINTVDINQEIPAGTYNAEVLYKTYFQGTDQGANGMNFPFSLTVS